MEEAEALLHAAHTAENCGDVAQAKELHLRILSLFPRTPEADEAIRYLTNVERAAPQRVGAEPQGEPEHARAKGHR